MSFSGDEFNPYRAPATFDDSSSRPVAPISEFRPQKVQIGRVFRDTWKVSSDNFGRIWIGILVLGGFNLLASGMSEAISSLKAEVNLDQSAVRTVEVCLILFSSAMGTWLNLGFALFLLRMCRKQANVNDIFGGGRFWIRGMVVSSPFIVIQLLHEELKSAPEIWMWILLLAIPVLIIFWPVTYVLVDQDRGVMSSLSLTARVTAGNRLLTVGLVVVFLTTCVLLGIAGGAIAFLVGAQDPEIFVMAGMAMVILTYLLLATFLVMLPVVLYMHMSGPPMYFDIPDDGEDTVTVE
jgi:hypothetical protein